MKKAFLFIFLLSTIISHATEKEIVAEVVFENYTNINLTTGKFFITELNKTIDIDSEENFTIILPNKGKYQFSFYTENFDSYTYYSARITSNKNVITVRLQEKGKKFNYKSKTQSNFNDTNEFAVDYENNVSNKSEEDGMNFIFNGINSSPVDFKAFKAKYGIGIVTKNCVVDPLTFKKSIEHNKYIIEHLNDKFGDEWKNDLPAQPFGVQ